MKSEVCWLKELKDQEEERWKGAIWSEDKEKDK